MTEKRERRRNRLATGIFHQPDEAFWSIQFYANADGSPGEIDLRIKATTPELAWEQFLRDTTMPKTHWESEGFKTVPIKL